MQKLFSKELASKLTLDIEEKVKNEEEKAKNRVLVKLNPELQQKIKEKEKLSIDEQIEYLNAKGVKFNITKDNEARLYLMENSYYYKVTAYRLNFKKIRMVFTRI